MLHRANCVSYFVETFPSVPSADPRAENQGYTIPPVAEPELPVPGLPPSLYYLPDTLLLTLPAPLHRARPKATDQMLPHQPIAHRPQAHLPCCSLQSYS